MSWVSDRVEVERVTRKSPERSRLCGLDERTDGREAAQRSAAGSGRYPPIQQPRMVNVMASAASLRLIGGVPNAAGRLLTSTTRTLLSLRTIDIPSVVRKPSWPNPVCSPTVYRVFSEVK